MKGFVEFSDSKRGCFRLVEESCWMGEYIGVGSGGVEFVVFKTWWEFAMVMFGFMMLIGF